MGLKTKIKNILKRPNKKEQAILRHEEAFAKHLDIKITYLDIVDKINAFDWLDIQEAKSLEEMAAVVFKMYKRFNFDVPLVYQPIVLKAFALKFNDAIMYFNEAIERTRQSYNIEGAGGGFQNDAVNKFYYISYWADKKQIPVNYNERSIEKRDLFNLDTIILSILADKLSMLNNFERNKPKKQ